MAKFRVGNRVRVNRSRFQIQQRQIDEGPEGVFRKASGFTHDACLESHLDLPAKVIETVRGLYLTLKYDDGFEYPFSASVVDRIK